MTMGSVFKTRDCFLWFMSLVYLFAFSSLYIQIPGLYGVNGILPANLAITGENKQSWKELMEGQPTLLKLMPRLGLDIQAGMDLLCLAGMVISFFCVVSRTARDFVSFTLLWMFYLSLYQVGQTFLWFQWDILLLEAGFLTMIIAPFNLQLLGRRWPASHAHDGITLWLAKWLLFRLMFASGVVKLTSQCPTWWGLTALNVHFESQCIPTPAAWYWHQIPSWLLRLSVVLTYVIEIPIPFLFFSPVRSLRLFAFWLQVLLQMLIIFTGNYNFFNLLTITLCVALLDDSFSLFSQPRSRKKSARPSAVWRILSVLANSLVPLVALGYIGYQTQRLFDLRFNADYTVHSKTSFNEKQFAHWLDVVMPVTIWLGAASLGLEVIVALIRSLVSEKGFFKKTIRVTGTAIFAVIAGFMFVISLVPHSYLDSRTYEILPTFTKTWHHSVEPFQITSSYGLFRKMTGVGGRPELIIEGHASERVSQHGWKAYEFLYKPGNVSLAPAVVAPHQPRLDWQMWFAALGNYQNNPWFVNLVYRLMQNQPEVLELLAENPFPDQPPKFIRATLYHYHYTSSSECAGKKNCDWWKRERKSEYFPAISLTDKSLVEYLTHAKLMQDDAPEKFRPEGWLGKLVLWFREMIGQPEGFSFTTSIFGSAIMVMFLNRAIF